MRREGGEVAIQFGDDPAVGSGTITSAIIAINEIGCVGGLVAQGFHAGSEVAKVLQFEAIEQPFRLLRIVDLAAAAIGRSASGRQFHGRSDSNSVALVRPETVRSSTSVSQACGLTPFSLAVWMSVMAIAQ